MADYITGMPSQIREGLPRLAGMFRVMLNGEIQLISLVERMQQALR